LKVIFWRTGYESPDHWCRRSRFSYYQPNCTGKQGCCRHDINPEAIRRISDNLDVQVMIGSGSSPVVLEEAGIRNAEIMPETTDNDKINLVACFLKKS
jgi:hypothetical protein